MPLVPTSITGRRGELIAPAVSYPGEKNGDWYGGAAFACDGNRSHSGTQSVTARRDGQSWGKPKDGVQYSTCVEDAREVRFLPSPPGLYGSACSLRPGSRPG